MKTRNALALLLAVIAANGGCRAGGTLNVPNAGREDVRAKLREQWTGYFDKETRVWNVSWPLMEENASLCPNISRQTGISWLNADRFKSTKNDRVYRYPIRGDDDELYAVQAIATGSPADTAGLKPGDIYRVLNRPKTTYSQRRRGEVPEMREYELEVVRGATTDTIMVPTVWACDTWVAVAKSSEVNAFFTDGKDIAVTEGLVDFVESDDELAFVIAHELAHIGLNHKHKRNRGLLGILLLVALDLLLTVLTLGDYDASCGASCEAAARSNAYSVEDESEADYHGAYMTARAGYDPAAAKAFFARMTESTTTPRVWGSTHPVSTARELNATIFADEVAAKKMAGERLLPEKKK